MLHTVESQWYDAWTPVFFLDPLDSYFITWLSREQRGLRWLLKSLAETIFIKVLLYKFVKSEAKGFPLNGSSTIVAFFVRNKERRIKKG
jgi:hypothetical protein